MFVCKTVLRVFAVVITLAVINAVHAGETITAAGKLRVVLTLEGNNANEQGRGRLAMHLINDGPGSLAIMTGMLQPATQMSDKGDGRIFIVFRSAPEMFHEGRRVVWADMDIRPVRLLANEEVQLPDIAPLLTQLPEGKINIAVAYEINTELAKRYGLWSGRIESNSIEITINRPQGR